jgi:N-methylhydantoinase A
MPTVTDGDVVLGRLDPDYFAGGSIKLDAERAGVAVDGAIGKPLGLKRLEAAFGVSEIVEENMANAARVHAVERGKVLEARTLIAFGGAAPLHAARLAEKLGIGRVMIPSGAGVGSAFGFLRAPVAYEVARSRYVRLDDTFDPDFVNALFAEMRAEAEAVVRAGAPDAKLVETRAADMRYNGQGHEITISLPLHRYDQSLKPGIVKSYETDYAAAFGRTIPGLDVEIMNWTLRLAAVTDALPACPPSPSASAAKPRQKRSVFAPEELVMQTVPIYHRDDLVAGSAMPGPAVITEVETTTIVPKGFSASIDPLGSIVLTKEQPQ